MKRSWLFYVSPCILAAVICIMAIVFGILGKESSGGWSYLLVIIFLPGLFILLLADFLIKALTKGNVLYIWIIEAVVIAILIFWSKNHFL